MTRGPTREMSVQASDRTQTAEPMQQGSSAFDRLFLEHPRDVGESYFQHMAHSASYGFRVLGTIFKEGRRRRSLRHPRHNVAPEVAKERARAAA